MDDNEQQSEISRELEKADRRIRIERLKKEVEEISGGEMVAWSSDEDEDSPVVEGFGNESLISRMLPAGRVSHSYMKRAWHCLCPTA